MKPLPYFSKLTQYILTFRIFLDSRPSVKVQSPSCLLLETGPETQGCYCMFVTVSLSHATTVGLDNGPSSETNHRRRRRRRSSASLFVQRRRSGGGGWGEQWRHRKSSFSSSSSSSSSSFNIKSEDRQQNWRPNLMTRWGWLILIYFQ